VSETPVNETADVPAAEENQGNVDENEYGNQILHGPVTGFQPTEEQPLAPSAPDAKGVENAPEGQLSLVVSLTGTSEPVQLEDGITVTVDDEIKVQCSMVNKTDEAITFSFLTGQKLDIIATTQDGEQAYKWSQDRRFAQVHNVYFLEAGDIWSHELTIPIGDNGLQPGTYNMEVIVTGSPELIVSASDVVILAGS
jgi:hypothetical protein